MVIIMASLPHDASGFLVGERLVNGIDLVGKDTTEILKILRASFGLQIISNNRLRVTLDRIINRLDRPTIDVTPTPSHTPRLGNSGGGVDPLPTVDIVAPTSDTQPISPTIEHGRDSGQVNEVGQSNLEIPIPSLSENENGSPTLPIPDIEPTLPPAPLDDSRRNNVRRNANGQLEGESAPPSDDPNSNNNRSDNGRRRNAQGQIEGNNAPPIDIVPPDDGRRGNGRRRNARGQFEGDNTPNSDAVPPDDGRRNNGRRRNSRGQFEGDGSGGLINSIRNAIRSGFALGNADTQNIDPTVDAVRELSDLMSPLAKVGKTMFKGAAWLFRRKKKREEPSDQEQRQQSRIEKLLKRIAGSRVGQAAGSGVNLFGGLFSSLTGTVGGALRFIPALISSIFSPIASVFRVVPSLIMGAIAPIGRVLTSLAPMLMRFLPIALGVTAAFKLGEWVGGKIYEAIAPTIADAIEWTVDAVKKAGDAYNAVIAKATSGIEAGVEIYNNAVANTTDNIVKLSDKTKGIWETGKGVYKQAVENTADNMKKAADLGGELWSGVKSIRQQAVDKLSGGMSYVADKIKPSKSVNDNQMMVFKAFKSTGMGDAQAKAMTAEVGRENDYNDKYLYGTHTDDKNGVTNQGMFSWQKDRRAKLVDFMQKRGLVDKGGNFAKGQESLNAQAEFAKGEIDSGKYEKTRQFFAQNPNASPEQAAQVLGKNYVGWRIDDPKYAPSGNAKRKAYGDNLDKQLSAATPSSTPTMPTVSAMAQAPLNTVNSGMTSTVSAKTFAPAIPTTVPKLLARPLPETPKVKQQVSTKEQPPMKVSVVDGGSTIGQNVSDRHLAHAVTGGLGMDALRMG